jgi:hypothetical protein
MLLVHAIVRHTLEVAVYCCYLSSQLLALSARTAVIAVYVVHIGCAGEPVSGVTTVHTCGASSHSALPKSAAARAALVLGCCRCR